MPINPNIALAYKPAQIKQPAPVDPMAMAGKMATLKNAMTQNKLAEAKLAKAGKPDQFKTPEDAAKFITSGTQFIQDSNAANIAGGMPQAQADALSQNQNIEFKQAFVGKGGGQNVLPDQYNKELYSSFSGADQRRKEETAKAEASTALAKTLATEKRAAQKEDTPTQLKKLIAERDALAPDDPNRAWYDKKLAGSKGITIAPDGTVTIGGAGSGLTKPVMTELQKEIKNIDVTMEGLDILEGTIDNLPDAAFEIMPRGLSTLKDWGTKIGRPMTKDEVKFEAKITDYAAKAGRYFDKYRKVVTGAQAGMRELAMLQRRVPVGEGGLMFDSRVDAKAKIEANRQFDSAVRGRLQQILNDGFAIVKNEEGDFLGKKDGKVVDLTYEYPLKLTETGFDGFEQKNAGWSVKRKQ